MEDEELGKVREIAERIKGLTTDEDDASFLSEQTYRRYLQARDWDINHAEKLLRSTIQWRRETKPHHVLCTYCQTKPGYHAMRHVGFDRLERPVLYANFAQCLTQHNVAEDAVQHMIFLTENAVRAMGPHVHQFVWVLDFTGMKVTSCNPHLAYAVEQIVSNHYPERLGACVCVNHGILFQAFWQAVKHFVPPATAKKVHADRRHDKVDKLFSQLFPEELKHWLFEEIRLNRLHPMPQEQKEFWKAENSGHDSRGCASYISKYLDNFPVEDFNAKKLMYLPHPNILQTITEKT